MNEVIYPVSACLNCNKPIPQHRKCDVCECNLCTKCEKCDARLCRSCDNKTTIFRWVEVDGKDIYLCSKCL